MIELKETSAGLKPSIILYRDIAEVNPSSYDYRTELIMYNYIVKEIEISLYLSREENQNYRDDVGLRKLESSILELLESGELDCTIVKGIDNNKKLYFSSKALEHIRTNYKVSSKEKDSLLLEKLDLCTSNKPYRKIVQLQETDVIQRIIRDFSCMPIKIKADNDIDFFDLVKHDIYKTFDRYNDSLESALSKIHNNFTNIEIKIS